MTDAQSSILRAVIRAALMVAFGSLVTRGLVKASVLGVAVDDLTTQVVGWIGAGAVTVWSLIEKKLDERKVKTALAMPPHATEADLKTVLKSTGSGTIPTPKEAAAIVAESKP